MGGSDVSTEGDREISSSRWFWRWLAVAAILLVAALVTATVFHNDVATLVLVALCGVITLVGILTVLKPLSTRSTERR